MKVVITGASGFLGGHLVRRLANDEKYEVYALSSRPEALRERFAGGSVRCFPKDAVTGSGAREILKDAAVVNCAYPRNSGGTAVADGLNYIRRVFEAARDCRAAAVVNVSSQSVYSQKRTSAATEETEVCPESMYAVGKYAAELMLEGICGGSGTCFTNLRLASLIGPDFDQRIVNRFLISMLAGEAVTVVRQEKKMGFLDVEDAVSAVAALLACPARTWRPVYNVGNGTGYTVEEIYRCAAAVLKKTVAVPEPLIETGEDASSTAVSFERLRTDTGFAPAVGLTESIERIAGAIRDRKGL